MLLVLLALGSVAVAYGIHASAPKGRSGPIGPATPIQYGGDEVVVEGSLEEGLTKSIAEETDKEFWRVTGYRPGHHLDPLNPADAEMVPVWLTLEYAQVSRHLDTMKAFSMTGPRDARDTVLFRFLSEYKQRLDQRFAADPTLDQRAVAVMKRLKPGSF